MSTLNPEILAGEQLARNLKNYFYANEPWTPKLAFEIGRMMTQLKRTARICYEELDTMAFLETLGRYSKQDVEDAIR